MAIFAYLEIKRKSFGRNWFSSYLSPVNSKYWKRDDHTSLHWVWQKLHWGSSSPHPSDQDSWQNVIFLCGADVIGKVSLSNHKRRHKIPAFENLRKHKCEKCPYESEVKSNVNRHKKQEHGQKPERVKTLGIVINVKPNIHQSMDMIDMWRPTRKEHHKVKIK